MNWVTVLLGIVVGVPLAFVLFMFFKWFFLDEADGIEEEDDYL